LTPFESNEKLILIIFNPRHIFLSCCSVSRWVIKRAGPMTKSRSACRPWNNL